MALDMLAVDQRCRLQFSRLFDYSAQEPEMIERDRSRNRWVG